MKTIEISGHSDDIVSVAGDLSDEYGSFGHATYLELSTGDVFCVKYDGVWRIAHLVVSGACDVTLTPHPAAEETDAGYTDRAKVSGPIFWVEAWPSWPARPRDVRDKVEGRLDGVYDDALFAAVWKAIQDHERDTRRG